MSMTHSCNHCKTEFRQKRRNQFYCNQSCRQMAYLGRKYAGSTTAPGNDKFAALAGLLGNIDPAALTQMLSSANQNPSMTDQLTDKPKTLANTSDSDNNPSQNVNNASSTVQKNSSSNSHDVYESYLKELRPGGEFYNSEGCTGVLKQMLDQGFTLKIAPKGYVRNLFPHWENKEWLLSVHVNEMMLKIFERLRKASIKSVISRKELTFCYEKMRDFCEGIYAFCLPADYPFRPFVYFLTDRLALLTDKSKGMDEIKFKVTDELREMMSILTIQLTIEK